jgi:NAD(P)-dependent dehydrogenase (short-subunit alcohol dehydrogenase family)
MSLDLPLSGRTVLLTGASRGIGAATAHALGEAGAHVIAHYGANRAGAEEATADIPETRRLLVSADLRQRDAPDRLWDAALGWRGRVDTLVCNAAVMPTSPLPAPDADWQSAWDDALEVNVRQSASLIRAAVEHFLEAGGGTIVVLSSWAAQRGSSNPELGVYAASKAALAAFAKTVARAHARDGVLVHLVAPGVVRTQMSVDAAQAQGGQEAVTAGLAMGEWVPPEEVADLVAFLAAGRCRHLSGATLDVNGASYIR